MTFSVAIDLVALVGTIGVFVWWLVRRKQWRDEPANLGFRAALSLVSATLLLAMGRWVGFGYGGAFIVPFSCVAFVVVMSIVWAPLIGEWVARPFTSLFDGGGQKVEPQPLYSIAEAKRKKGRYHEAVFAIHEQLRKFPNDLTGQVLLAEIQAQNLNDLPGAQLTIQRLCEQKGHAAANIAIALNQLADWHLKVAQDIDSARQALEKIAELLPGSEQAQIAAHRIAHLGTTENLLSSHQREVFRLRPGVNNVGLLKDSSSLQKPPEDPAAKAAEYVQHLEVHPLDSEVREKLALIYAEHYQRLDLATEQLEQLIQQPNHPGKQQAHWLNLLAGLHIQYGQDYELARGALQRIIDFHAGTAIAALAEQRLAHLKLDLKGKEKSHGVKLGTYEQNIGLKKSRPK